MLSLLLGFIITLIVTVFQIGLAGSFPLALLTYSAWLWLAGPSRITPWALASVIIIDLYSSAFGINMAVWAITIATISLLVKKVFTNRSLPALLAVLLTTYVLSSLVRWGIWYGLAWVIPSAPRITFRNDIDVAGFIIKIALVILYGVCIWYIGGKKFATRQVFLVGGQII